MDFDKSLDHNLQQHHIRQSTRLSGYDYSQSGAYFVTICTYKHQSILASISNGVVQLNPTGEKVQTCWMEIAQHFAFAEISTYVIMPNHVHGIVVINKLAWEQNASTRDAGTESFGKPVSSSLPTIIRSYKSAATRRVNLSLGNKSNLWQKGYYEHVIRSEKELVQIGEYILGNPQKWETDRENPHRMRKEKPMPFEY
jgi:putative transposase